MWRRDVLLRWQMCMLAPVPAAAPTISSAPSSELTGSTLDFAREWVKTPTPSLEAS
jgi:hypothetical protein